VLTPALPRRLQGIEKKKRETMAIMAVISVGVGIASYGELAFVLTGVLFQMASILTESNRIVLVQILLQSKGVKLNPITSMYYISPCCLIFLFWPWLYLEFPRLAEQTGDHKWLDANGCFIFLSNAAAAFTLNCAVFLLIGKSSALTMNIAGVVKDWLLIYLSWVLFAGPISGLNLFGYGIAFLAVCYYNYSKLKAMNEENALKSTDAKAAESEEGKTGAAPPAGADGPEEAEMRKARVAALKAELAKLEAGE
jgi:hypothetical protein